MSNEEMETLQWTRRYIETLEENLRKLGVSQVEMRWQPHKEKTERREIITFKDAVR